MNLDDQLFEDSQARDRELPSDEKLSQLAELAGRVRECDSELEQLEAQLKQLKEQRRRLVEYDIPDTMHELGMEQFTLSDGTGVELRPEVYASIPERSRDEALAWLYENGFGDLVKNTLTLQFGRGEDEYARQLAEDFVKIGYNFTQKKTVLPQTLKAWVREQDARGNPVPEELFNVHRATVAKLKEPK